jgi:hypothetical protein
MAFGVSVVSLSSIAILVEQNCQNLEKALQILLI